MRIEARAVLMVLVAKRRTLWHVDLLYLLGASVYKAAENEGLQPDPQNLAELGKSLYTLR